MAMVHDVPGEERWLTRVLTTDFCPWAHCLFDWLKQPVGWFVLATVFSVLIGLYVAPVGWMIAASLVTLVLVGMVWPWVAVRVVSCALESESDRVHEEDPCKLTLSVRNRIPFPVWGLAVEGFLDRATEDVHSSAAPTVALASVRGLTTSCYRFIVRPPLRGHYPRGDVSLVCAFPFGIWTARRELNRVSPVTVWPRLFPIAGHFAPAGGPIGDCGQGSRSGRTDDFTGLREYRLGDCIRQINWIATARSGSLVVTERSGPQCPRLDVFVDVETPGTESQEKACELTDRIRVAASVLANLHRSGIPLRVHVGDQRVDVKRGRDGWIEMMDVLADVPADGLRCPGATETTCRGVSITITSDVLGNPVVDLVDPKLNRRSLQRGRRRVIDRQQDLEPQVLRLWSEVRDVCLVA